MMENYGRHIEAFESQSHWFRNRGEDTQRIATGHDWAEAQKPVSESFWDILTNAEGKAGVRRNSHGHPITMAHRDY